MINNDKNDKNELNKHELNMNELEMVTGGGVIEVTDIFHNNNYDDNNGGPIDDYVSGRFYVG